MNILFTNAKAYIEKELFQEAVLVSGNRIRAVGRTEDLVQMAGSSCERLDCGGRTLLPGFNDSHMHLMEFGEGRRQAQLSQAASIEDLIRICRDFARAKPEAVKNGLRAAGWNQNHFSVPRIPDRHDLDRISTSMPVVAERVCGHIVSANTKAIEMLGLDTDSPQYPDGEFLREENGFPSGVFTGGACLHARKLIPDFTEEEKLDILEEASAYAASRGITSVQSNDVGAMTGSSGKKFALFRRFFRQGRSCIRFRHQVNFDSFEAFREEVEKGEYAKAKENYDPASLLSLGPLKLFADGSLGARTALLKRGYYDDPSNHGRTWTDGEELFRFCRYAARHGIQIVTHCIGDAAIDRTAEAYIRSTREVLHREDNPLRHSLVHCQITDRQILEKIARHGLLTMLQPIFLHGDIPILDKAVGRELASASYAFGTLIRETGPAASFGTDCPVEDCNPFPNIYCAVTRRRLDGSPGEGFVPAERISVSRAVDAYTLASAFAQFREHELGRIKPGYLADLTLLDRDIFTCPEKDIKNIRPVLTMTDGEIVFER